MSLPTRVSSNMTSPSLAAAFVSIALLTAMPQGRADYNYRCDPLPAPIMVEKNGPLPDGLSPLARKHVDAFRSHIETEVIPISAPNIVILRHLFRNPMVLIIVELEGREHNFYMRKLQPVLISGTGVVGEHTHKDIGLVGEYTLRLITSFRADEALGTSIEVSLDFFRLAAQDGRGCLR
jgi:hypothetical protein